MQPEKHFTWIGRILRPSGFTFIVAVFCIVSILFAIRAFLSITPLSAIHPDRSSNSFQLRPGWQQVAVYSGRGNSTRTVQRSLPPLWAAVVTCTGDKVSVTLEGAKSQEQVGTDSCHYPELSLNQPTSFSYTAGSQQAIQTIKVTANARTSWQLHLLQAIHQPTSYVGSEWRLGQAMSGSGITFTRNSPHDAWHRHPLVTSEMAGDLTGENLSVPTWGIVAICFGKGSGHIQLFPAVGNLPLPVCDGQPKLTVVHFPGPTTVRDLEVTASGDMIWHVGIVACLNEARCKPSTSSPGDTSLAHVRSSAEPS